MTDLLPADVKPTVGVDMESNTMLAVDTDISTEVMLGVSIDLLPDIAVIVMATLAINLAFMVEEAYETGIVTGVVSVIDVDVLADENVNGLIAVMTPSEVTLPAP